jgi:hypothetical protein
MIMTTIYDPDGVPAKGKYWVLWSDAPYERFKAIGYSPAPGEESPTEHHSEIVRRYASFGEHLGERLGLLAILLDERGESFCLFPRCSGLQGQEWDMLKLGWRRITSNQGSRVMFSEGTK